MPSMRYYRIFAHRCPRDAPSWGAVGVELTPAGVGVILSPPTFLLPGIEP